MSSNCLNLRGRVQVEHWRDGKLLRVLDFPNGITNEGKNKLLDVMFHGDAPITTWYLGLIDGSGFTALAAGDTYANINQAGNGWDEFGAYTDTNNSASATTRPTWPEDAAAGQVISNTTLAIFHITTGGTVKGLFVVGGIPAAQTKNDHAAGGVLWATAFFNTGDQAVAIGDDLKVTYSVSA